MAETSGFHIPEKLLQSAAGYLFLHYQPEEAEFLEAAKIRKASRRPRTDFLGSLPEPRGVEMSRPSCAPSAAPSGVPEDLQSPLEKAVSHLGESFQQRLLRVIDERGLSDAEVYRRAGVDRK